MARESPPRSHEQQEPDCCRYVGLVSTKHSPRNDATIRFLLNALAINLLSPANSSGRLDLLLLLPIEDGLPLNLWALFRRTG